MLPPVKRKLDFPKANGEKVAKKPKKEVVPCCCGRCGEFLAVCLKMANDTQPTIQAFKVMSSDVAPLGLNIRNSHARGVR